MKNGSLKLIAILFGVLLLGYFAVKLIMGLVSAAIGLLIPVALIAVVAYVLYAAVGRKALGTSRRRMLP